MGFHYPINGGGGGGGVTDLNGLTGAVTLLEGAGIDITTSGSDITIAAIGANVPSDSDLAVKVATTAVLPGSPTYNNGTAGIGATLTRSSNGTTGTIDGITAANLMAGDYILVKNQAAQLQNGVYSVTQQGTASLPYILTRVTEADTTAELDDLVVTAALGTTNKGIPYGQQTNNPVIGTNNIVFTATGIYMRQQTSGTQAIGQIPYYTATALTLTKGDADFVRNVTGGSTKIYNTYDDMLGTTYTGGLWTQTGSVGIIQKNNVTSDLVYSNLNAQTNSYDISVSNQLGGDTQTIHVDTSSIYAKIYNDSDGSTNGFDVTKSTGITRLGSLSGGSGFKLTVNDQGQSARIGTNADRFNIDALSGDATILTSISGKSFGIKDFSTSDIGMFIGNSSPVFGLGNMATTGSNMYIDDTAKTITVKGGVNGTQILIDDTAQLITISNVPDYADDAAAATGGLTTGQLYQTTSSGSTFLKIVP